MDYRKEFEFQHLEYREEDNFTVFLSGSGSIVITAPDVPMKPGIIHPSIDDRIAVEFVESLQKVTVRGVRTYKGDNLVRVPFERLPYETEILVKDINEEDLLKDGYYPNLPVRWSQITGYRLKEISFASLYPDVIVDNVMRINNKHLRGMIRSMTERKKELERKLRELEPQWDPFYDETLETIDNPAFLEMYYEYEAMSYFAFYSNYGYTLDYRERMKQIDEADGSEDGLPDW